MAKKTLKVEIGNYDARGTKLGKNFMTKMKSFPFLIEYTKDEKNGLDVQLRGAYINIYYQGGNLVKLSGQQKCDLDENYFYLPKKEGLPMTDIERLCHKDYKNKAKQSKMLRDKSDTELEELRQQASTIKKNIKKERDKLVNRLKCCESLEEVEIVVGEMKEVMEQWKKALVNNGRRKQSAGERAVQHYISLYNKKFDEMTDFVVLDIEYAISTNALYAKEEEREKQPRIDILAIEKGTGQVYVMELKYGMKAVNGEASAEKHYEDYLATVGNDTKWQSFIDDVKILLQAKQKQKMIDEDIKIKDSKPVFVFVMKQEKESDEDSFRKHVETSEKLKKSKIQTIYLPVEAEKDYKNPSSMGHKLSKKYMRE